MTSTRGVVDTNILLSRLLLPQSIAGRAVSRLIRPRVWVSNDTLTERAQTSARQKCNRYLRLHDRQAFFGWYARLAESVHGTTTRRLCRAPKDDPFLALARAGHAQMRDQRQRFTGVIPYQGLPICTPADVRTLPESLLAARTGGARSA